MDDKNKEMHKISCIIVDILGLSDFNREDCKSILKGLIKTMPMTEYG